MFHDKIPPFHSCSSASSYLIRIWNLERGSYKSEMSFEFKAMA